ncbi:MAG: esterase-like activity of phytase family protein [Kiritimatiellae bacterium]|nr:esterase-like activity of phytase family protein [Kiritimatiellia bacterium]
MSHKYANIALLLLAWGLSPWRAGAATGKLSSLGALDRPPSPDSLSSLTLVSNGVYWAATDWDPALYELHVGFAEDGTPQKLEISHKCDLIGGKDIEGLARDPLRGTVWAADEGLREVAEYDPVSGKRLSEVAIPEILKTTRRTFGFESLTISADGLEMWLANEEALKGDGAVATTGKGTTVRLARFTRSSGLSPWQAAGQWAYVTDGLAGSAPFDSCRSGLSDLCLLADGTMLALEREYSFKPLPSLRCRIYAIDRTGATDVADRASLAPEAPAFTPVRKRLLFDANSGLANFEGLAPGPMLGEGVRTLVLVSDGGQMMARKIMVVGGSF